MYRVILAAQPKRIVSERFLNVLKSDDRDDVPDAVVIHEDNKGLLGQASSRMNEFSLPHYVMFRDDGVIDTLLGDVSLCIGQASFRGIVLFGKPTKETVSRVRKALAEAHQDFFSSRHMLVAMEDSQTLSRISDFIDDPDIAGFFVGSSYMSENVEMYKRMDHSTFKILIRSATKHIHAKNKFAYGTGGFCSYDSEEHRGDRNWQFATSCADAGIKIGFDGGIIKYLNHVNMVHKLFKGLPLKDFIFTSK